MAQRLWFRYGHYVRFPRITVRQAWVVVPSAASQDTPLPRRFLEFFT